MPDKEIFILKIVWKKSIALLHHFTQAVQRANLRRTAGDPTWVILENFDCWSSSRFEQGDRPSSLPSTDVKAYNGALQFRPFKLILINHRTANQSNGMSLVERTGDGRNFVITAYAWTSVLQRKLRRSPCANHVYAGSMKKLKWP